MARRANRFLWPWLGAALVVAACGRRDHAAPPPGPATDSSRAPSTLEEWHVGRGQAPFLIRAPLLTLRGRAEELGGRVQIDVADLTRVRGVVSVDLTSLAMTSFLDAGENRRQTADAHRWLEVDASRTADFTLQDVLSAEPGDLTRVPGSVRKARMKVRGELSLHGRTAPLEATLEADFAFDGDVAKHVFVRTVDDLHVDLATFDVRPRDEKGKLLAKVNALYRDKVGETADVALTMALEPGPTDLR